MGWSARACLGALAVGALLGVSSVRAQGPAATECPEESDSGLMGAIERAAAKSEQPERKRMDLLARIQMSNACYPLPTNNQEYDTMVAATGLLAPTQGTGFGPRFLNVTKCWLGAAGIGDANRSQPAQLTYSFPDDGVIWGGSGCTVYGTGPNDLNARLIGMFGFIDRGREMMRSSLAAWRRVGGLTYTEVADDNSPQDQSAVSIPGRGDIRLGGWAFAPIVTGQSLPPLAYNGFPNEPGSCSGGDMTINTAYFGLSNQYITDVTGNWLYFRNTVAHEHGHGLGMLHTVPCNQTKLMEPSISLGPILLSPDEVRGAIRNYGDRYSPLNNHYSYTPKDFGNLTTPVLRSVFERDLGVNGRSFFVSGGPNLSDDDYFKFTIDTTQSVTISVYPTGYTPIGACCAGGVCTSSVSQVNCTGTWVIRGTCSANSCVNATLTTTCSGSTNDPAWCQGAQTSQCSGSIGSIEAQNAGNLALALLQSNGTTQIATSDSATLGVTETITMPALAPGTYVVQVWDSSGGQTPNNQVVQTYDLMIRVGSSHSPPVAIAGLNAKRAQANQRCYFIGSHNSYATDNGATIPGANYEWDLDGDGVFETVNSPQPFTTYVSNGTYLVTLRVTDTNLLKATDTIQVTVWGATTSITSVSPSSGVQGATVPVTINGTNFKGATSGSVTVSGSGVSVIGTASVNTLGTAITGLSFVIDGAAASGARNVVINNTVGPGGSATGVGVFTVSGTTGACCAADGSCVVLASGSCSGSFQGSGTTCPPNPCPQPNVACCAANGGCTFVTAAACGTGGGTAQAYGSNCSPNVCAQPSVACCAANGGCTFVTAAACGTSGGTAQAYGSNCSPNVCAQPSVACCAANGGCTFVTAASCGASGGTAQAFGSSCASNPCPQPPGACCFGTTCSVMAQGACAGVNRRFVGIGTACNGGANFVTPCCAADFNQDSVRNVTDIFAFLSAWFASDPSADINGGGLAVNDIFAFLSAWFAGC